MRLGGMAGGVLRGAAVATDGGAKEVSEGVHEGMQGGECRGERQGVRRGVELAQLLSKQSLLPPHGTPSQGGWRPPPGTPRLLQKGVCQGVCQGGCQGQK